MARLIVSDSCLEINENIFKNIEVKQAPFFINIEENHFLADENVDVENLLNEMKKSKQVTKTAAPTPESFYELSKGYDEVYMITISSKLSTAYNSAVIAKTMLEDEDENIKVHVFDSKSAANGETLIGMKIEELINENKTFEEIVEKTEKFINEIKTIFVLEDLDNLIKNGRVSKVAGIISSVLSIYPICIGVDGVIEVKHKVRGIKQALKKLIDTVGEMGSGFENKTLTITHIQNEDRANQIKSMIEEIYNFKKIEIFRATALSATYANRNGIILAY